MTEKDNKNHDKIFLMLSIPLAVLVIITSIIGIFTPDFYSKASLNWQVQSIGQDIIDLFLIVPCLLITSIFTSRGKKSAEILWGGTVLYLTYTFVIFCFDIHFNNLFILYCIELGLSFYSSIYFLFKAKVSDEEVPEKLKNSYIRKFTGIYFLIISGVFSLLWLSEIIPAIIGNTTPQSLIEIGLITNPVHVIDLSVFLPGIFLTGIFLLKKKTIGFILAPVILMFFILMDISIGFLIVLMKLKGIEGDLTLTFVMSALALFSLMILVLYLKIIRSKSENRVVDLKPKFY